MSVYITRDGGGISLNAGHRETICGDDQKPRPFKNKKEAVAFLRANKVPKSAIDTFRFPTKVSLDVREKAAR